MKCFEVSKEERRAQGNHSGTSDTGGSFTVRKCIHKLISEDNKATGPTHLFSMSPREQGKVETEVGLRLPLEMSPGREAACRAVFATWGLFRTMHGKTAPSC